MKRKYSEDKIETGTSTIHKASSTVATGANAISINTQRKPNLHQTKPVALPSQPSREVKGEGFRRISTLTKFQDRAWVEKFHQSLRRQRNITQDPWVRKGSIQPDSVVCNGCRQRVSLKNKERDVQGGYSNPGWVEHRERCYLLYLQWCKERNYDPKEIKKEKGG
ncbi:hypothetical protein CPB85DRAFT_635382 [Mucidula mucida]|nr:hypothetical protein CPB85DRAFT_635382 [Mucidula mucida]